MKKVINDLFDYKGYKIVQNNELFKFSLDSILLAEFINIKLKTNNILDLCTGNAPIPLILSSRTKSKIYGIEYQRKIAQLAMENIKINKKENQISIIHDDCKNCSKIFKSEYFDIVSCNPPYFKYQADSYINSNSMKAIARHEIKINIEDIIKISFKMLKNEGYLYLSHRPERLIEIIKLLNKNNFALKTMQFIYSKKTGNAIIVLIEATKNGKMGLKVAKPIFIDEYDSYKNIFKEVIA